MGLWVNFCVVVFVACVAIANCEDSPKKKRLVLIEEMRQKGPLLMLDADDYDRFVHKGPRPYHVIVLAAPLSDPRYGQTKRIAENLVDVSNSYEEHLSKQRANGLLAREIVFAVVDTALVTHVLEEHEINVPVALLALPPTTTPGIEPIKFPNLALYNFRQSWTAASISKWVSDCTKVPFKFQERFIVQATPYIVGFVCVGVLAFMFWVASPNLPSPKTPRFWFGVCAFVWMLVTSGMHFCILRDMPPLGFDQRSQSIMIFHPSPNSQFAIEGLIVTASELFAGMLLVGLVEVYPTMSSDSPEERKVVGFMFAGLTFFAMLFVRFLFMRKQHWI